MNRLHRSLYFPINRINNKFPWQQNDLFTIEKFTCKYLGDAEHFYEKDSPSRRLSNLFWLNLPWDTLRKELGALHIFDTGCGSGGYAIRLQNWSGQQIASYCGMDFQSHERWAALQAQYPFVSFIQGDATNVEKYIPEETDVFITQSALEHIEMDILYFRRIHEFIARRRRNTVQVHLLPSPACLDLYGFHGVRQYTPRTIAKIVRFYKNDSYAVLYSLGGVQCNRLHTTYITDPIVSGAGDLRDTQTEVYKARLQEAIENDMAVQNGQNDPSFYALIIHSFYNRKLFLGPKR